MDWRMAEEQSVCFASSKAQFNPSPSKKQNKTKKAHARNLL
jgi:hypothetical protein